ncbi:MAG: ribonuclease HI [Chloroflexi bacterium]|nr:ribonuclease HI [Chloroflexota bacterium]
MSEDTKLQLRRVTVFTDGSAIGNPGPGGYGVVLKYAKHRKELSSGFRLTTNNRMELLGAIVALESLTERCRITLHSDSKYVIDGIRRGWAKKWKAAGWMRNPKEPAINVDLWEKMLALCDKHEVGFRWVKGHSGVVENERCDELAVTAARGVGLLIDHGYEQRS